MNNNLLWELNEVISLALLFATPHILTPTFPHASRNLKCNCLTTYACVASRLTYYAWASDSVASPETSCSIKEQSFQTPNASHTKIRPRWTVPARTSARAKQSRKTQKHHQDTPFCDQVPTDVNNRFPRRLILTSAKSKRGHVSLNTEQLSLYDYDDDVLDQKFDDEEFEKFIAPKGGRVNRFLKAVETSSRSRSQTLYPDRRGTLMCLLSAL